MTSRRITTRNNRGQQGRPGSRRSIDKVNVKQKLKKMQTTDDAREHCRFVGNGIEKMDAVGENLRERFEGIKMIHILVEKSV